MEKKSAWLVMQYWNNGEHEWEDHYAEDTSCIKAFLKKEDAINYATNIVPTKEQCEFPTDDTEFIQCHLIGTTPSTGYTHWTYPGYRNSVFPDDIDFHVGGPQTVAVWAAECRHLEVFAYYLSEVPLG